MKVLKAVENLSYACVLSEKTRVCVARRNTTIERQVSRQVKGDTVLLVFCLCSCLYV